jgi:DNA-binding MarR family transcriptional regulator
VEREVAQLSVGKRLADDRAFTALQGQYLAFIQAYTLIHRISPSEADIQRFFRVSPPSVHQMVLRLAERGWVERVPGKARSLRVLVAPEALPALEDPRMNDEVPG